MTERTHYTAAILNAWRAEVPLTSERALELANEILLDRPKEKRDFDAWFRKNGEASLARVNGG